MEESPEPTAAARRHTGYLRALEEASVRADDRLLIGPIPRNRTAGSDAIARLLEDGVGFDSVEECRFASPTLTTIESGREWIDVPRWWRNARRSEVELGDHAKVGSQPLSHVR
jgi:DNA-binding LacI/PurR family transcriptional regulator